MAKRVTKNTTKSALATMKGTSSNAGLKNYTSAPAPVPSGGATTKSYNTFANYANSLAATAPGGAISSPGAISGSPSPQASYSISDPNGRIAQVDSTFRDQEESYNEGLKKFLADIDLKRKGLTRDTDTARAGVSRNREMGLTGINEDFAARGLGHSGLLIDAKRRGEDSYTRQDDALTNALTDGTNDLNFAAEKEQASTASRIQAAKRDALYRLQLNNNLVTGL